MRIVALLFLSACGLPSIEETCELRVTGEGSCTMTNVGTKAGKLCGYVEVDRRGTEHNQVSPTVCSGDLEPGATKTIALEVPDVPLLCYPDGQKTWEQTCVLKFVDKAQ